MNYLDWLILGLLVYNGVSGLMSGLLRALLNIVAMLGAYVCLPFVKPILSQLLVSQMEMPESLALPLSGFLGWGLIYVVLSALGLGVIKTLDKTPLKPLDRLAGAAFGLSIASLMILVPLTVVQALPFVRDWPPVQNTLQRSLLVPQIQPVISLVETQVGGLVRKWWDQPQSIPGLPNPNALGTQAPGVLKGASDKKGAQKPLPQGTQK